MLIPDSPDVDFGTSTSLVGAVAEGRGTVCSALPLGKALTGPRCGAAPVATAGIRD